MADIAMVLVATFMRAVIRRGRVPVRIRHIAPSVVRIKRVAAMYASLESHAGQGTRRSCKSVLVSDDNQRFAEYVRAIQGFASPRLQINYLLKLT